VQHVMATVAPMYRDRPGGYTRIVKLGKHRLGDATDLVMLELVGKEEGPQIRGQSSRRRKIAEGRAAFAAKLMAERKGGVTAAAEPESAPEASSEGESA
jgi:large subunit ribosomal protein L17